jgi:hypothetical protein
MTTTATFQPYFSINIDTFEIDADWSDSLSHTTTDTTTNYDESPEYLTAATIMDTRLAAIRELLDHDESALAFLVRPFFAKVNEEVS